MTCIVKLYLSLAVPAKVVPAKAAAPAAESSSSSEDSSDSEEEKKTAKAPAKAPAKVYFTSKYFSSRVTCSHKALEIRLNINILIQHLILDGLSPIDNTV